MRIMVFFDLPVDKPKKRKIATKFRKFLLEDGYDMLQYSVYCRICNGPDTVGKHMVRLESRLPDEGSVRSLVVTERQYGDMKIHVGAHTDEEKYLTDSLFTQL
ncbi:MAG: CRISPR-associated endonuclease Cas2 [Patescibacteria group bacterium]